MSFLRPSQSRRSLESWKTALAQARKALWQGDLAAARALYEKVARQAGAEKTRDLNDPLFRCRALAALGLWGAAYLQDNTLGGEYEAHLQSVQADREVWRFIANVFSLTRDTTPPALRAYGELLRAAPLEKVAQTVEPILAPAGYSPECLELYERIDAILPFDPARALRLVHWGLKAGRGETAGAAAWRLLDADPQHPDAHRCLGCLAEQSRDWETAARHYTAVQEWLRLGVAANYLGRPQRALDALEHIPPQARQSPEWLYHAGWASFQAGRPRQAYEHWTRLKTLFPAHQAEIDRHLLALARQAVVDEPALLVEGKDWPDHPLIDVYQVQAGANLLVSGRRVEAEALLTRIVKRQPKNAVPNIFLGLCKAGDNRELAADTKIYERLVKYYRNASLFLWLRGLLLGRECPAVAQQYLNKACQEGLRHFLPAGAIQATLWLVEQVIAATSSSPGEVGSSLLDHWPEAENTAVDFYRAAAPVAVLQAIYTSQLTVPSLERALAVGGAPAASWQRVALVACARLGQWRSILAYLPLDEDAPMTLRYLVAGLRQVLLQRDCQLAARYAGRGLALDPAHAGLARIYRGLRGYTQEALWQQEQYAEVAAQIESQAGEQTAAGASVHHNLALLYTQQAIQGNLSGQPDALSLWYKAIGHWAVTLADEDYWQTWAGRREGGRPSPGDQELDELRAKTLPGILLRYWSAKAGKSPDAQAGHYHAFRALFNQQVRAARAMLAALESARRQKIALPDEIGQWVSPLLLQEHRVQAGIAAFSDVLPSLDLPKAQVELIQQAFSPLAEAQALAADGQFRMAIDRLDELEKRHPGQGQWLAGLRSERKKAIDAYARELLKSEAWDDAVQQLDRILVTGPAEDRNTPEQAGLRKLYTQALVGWAQVKLDQGEAGRVVKTIKTVRGKKVEDNKEYRTVLAEALARWGEDALKEDDFQAAQPRLEEARKVDAGNRRAAAGLGAIWARNASQEAEKQHWDAACAYARKAYDLSPGTESGQLWGAIAYDYAVLLQQRSNLAAARDALLPVMEISLPEEMAAAVRKLLSSVWTDQGIQLLRSGDARQAVEAWELALQADPQNETARAQLRGARGYAP